MVKHYITAGRGQKCDRAEIFKQEKRVQQYFSATTDLLYHHSSMRISPHTSNPRTHVPVASHLLSCHIRGVSDRCWESLKSSRLRKRRVVPAKKLSAGFAHVAESLGKLHFLARWQSFFSRNEFVCACHRGILRASV